MNALIQIYALLSLAAPPPREVTYGFATSDYIIEMRIRSLRPSSGWRLAFYSSLEPAKEVCYSGDERAPDQCVQRFVGAAAIVTFVVKLPGGGLVDGAAIREHVAVLSQSCGLSPRAPFSKTQALVNGTATDLQVFGYDEAAVNKADRRRRRAHMRAQWMLFRQKLYIDGDEKPFAIVEWKHMLHRISIVRIYAPPDPYREPFRDTPRKLAASCRAETS